MRLHTPFPPAKMGGAHQPEASQNIRMEPFCGPNAGLTADVGAHGCAPLRNTVPVERDASTFKDANFRRPLSAEIPLEGRLRAPLIVDLIESAAVVAQLVSADAQHLQVAEVA